MTSLAKKFRVPLNRAALMSQIQHMVGTGYVYWHAGEVLAEKAAGLHDKFCSLYPVLATPSMRATAKRKSIANVNLLWGPSESRLDSVRWILLATRGRGEQREDYPDLIHRREKMKDVRKVPLIWSTHYFLHQRSLTDFSSPENKQRKRGTRLRWTWSMTPETFNGWRDQVIQAAQQGDREYQSTFSHLLPSPLFGGIRQDIRRLEEEGRVAWKKAHRNVEYRRPLPDPLPTMPRIQVFGEMTLWSLLETVRNDRDTAEARALAEAKVAFNKY